MPNKTGSGQKSTSGKDAPKKKSNSGPWHKTVAPFKFDMATGLNPSQQIKNSFPNFKGEMFTITTVQKTGQVEHYAVLRLQGGYPEGGTEEDWQIVNCHELPFLQQNLTNPKQGEMHSAIRNAETAYFTSELLKGASKFIGHVSICEKHDAKTDGVHYLQNKSKTTVNRTEKLEECRANYAADLQKKIAALPMVRCKINPTIGVIDTDKIADISKEHKALKMDPKKGWRQYLLKKNKLWNEFETKLSQYRASRGPEMQPIFLAEWQLANPHETRMGSRGRSLQTPLLALRGASFQAVKDAFQNVILDAFLLPEPEPEIP